MFHQTFLFLGQLWQLFEVSQILEFLRYCTVIFSKISSICNKLQCVSSGTDQQLLLSQIKKR